MTAVFINFIFCLSIWQISHFPYGDCRGNSADVKPLAFLSSNDSKSRKVVTIESPQVSNDTLDEVGIKRAIYSHDGRLDASKDTNQPTTDGIENKNKSILVKEKKKIQEESELETRRKLISRVDDVTTSTLSQKPVSRGRLRFQHETSSETVRSKGLNIQSAESTLPPNISSTVTNSEIVTPDSKKNTDNSTRSGKSSNFRRVGSDGYVFERTVDLAGDEDRDRDSTEEFHFEPLDVTHLPGEPENNIDRIRNYNGNSGQVELKNIVKKPQGFSLTTTEPRLEPEVFHRNSVRPGSIKRKPTTSVISDAAPMISLTNPNSPLSSSTENSSPFLSKNEISRKPVAKPNNIRKRVNGNDNLPTTSAVWTLAALKTPVGTKIQKRPASEPTRKNNVEVITAHKPALMPMTTIRPFVSWSTRLQKTTTEDSIDLATTLKPALEVNAETIIPLLPGGPKLMNISEVQSPKESRPSTKKMENEDVVYSTETIIRSSTILSDLIASSRPTTSGNLTLTTAQSFTDDDDVRIHLVDDNSADKDRPLELNTDTQQAMTKNSDAEFGRFNYSIDGNDVNVTSIEHQSEPISNEDESKSDILNDSPTRHEEHEMNVNISNNTKINDNDATMKISTTEIAPGSTSSFPSTNASTLISSTSPLKTFSSHSTVLPDNSELNIIFDQADGNYKDKKSPSQIIVNSIEKTESNNRINVTTEISPETASQEYSPTLTNNSVLSEENHDMETTETYPLYEIEMDDKKQNQSSAMNGTHNSDENMEFHSNRTTLFTTGLKNVSPPTTDSPILTTSAPADTEVVISTTIQNPMLNFSSTTKFSISESMASISSTSSTTHQPVWISDEDISTDTITTSVSPSTSTASVTEHINSSSTHSKNIEYSSYDSEEQMTTSSSSRKSTPSTTSSESFSIIYSSSSEETTASTSTSTFASSTEEILVVPPFKPNLQPENVPGYLMLFFKSSFAKICEASSTLRENLFQYITQRSIRVQSKDQVVMVIDPEQCKEPDHSLRLIPVALYVVDDVGSYDKTLIDEMKKLLEEENLNSLPDIHEIVYHENIAPNNSRVIAAMVITSIAAVCFVLLIFLMCTIRNRQKMSYGQRCTPVSMEDYNLDNISDYNSIRRKGMMRASKRSYGNPAFDDPLGPSRSLTYNGLIKIVDNRTGLDEEFSQIPTVIVKPNELPPGAEIKNRYANVIPLPETRVSLSSNNNCSDSVHDYINANYVKGFKDADKFYIACQAPLQSTIEDFWKMVWKEQTKVIIMLTALSENGVEKCADYLPPSEILDCHRLFGDFQVTLKKREVKEKYVISTIQLKNMENSLWREIHHLWYTNWPIQGVPCEQSSIIAFLIEARAYMRNSSGPHVMHCSPGTGRTGTVLAIDICIRDYEMSRSVNIPATVAKLRRCRAGAVQTKEQYAFIYKVLALYARKLNGGAPLDSM